MTHFWADVFRGNEQLFAYDHRVSDRKFFVFCRNMFAFALFGHILFIPIFYLLGNPLIFTNNIIAVFLDMVCLWANYKKWHGRLLLWACEIALHAFFCVIVFGWAQGYSYYLLALVPIVFYSRCRFSARLIVAGSLFLATLFLYHYSRTHLPITETRYSMTLFVYVCNLLANFVGLSYASFYYRRYSDRLEHELLKLAQTDVLTGIHNRRSFEHQATNALEHHLLEKEDCALFIVDVDHFKRINDSFGHPVGDQALQRVTEACRRSLRADDLFGRIGGEEFAVFLSHTDSLEAMRIAERVRQNIELCRIELSDKTRLFLTVSIGVTVLHATNHTLSQMMSSADQALYQAKNSGRNRVALLNE